MEASTALNFINALIVVIGVPSLVAAFVYIGRQLQALDALGATMQAMKHNVSLCIFALIKMNKIGSDEVVTFSPASLTRIGTDHISRVGIKAVIDDETNRRVLFSDMAADRPRTKYDVEMMAVNVILEAVVQNAPMMRPAKAYLYSHPSEDLLSVAYMAGLYLRDQYLSAHPEIAE